jgi:short-subunit dehydrogenase
MAHEGLAVVTGASSGIGLELARLFAADGYDLVVIANEPQIVDVAAELAGTGVHVEPVRGDLPGEEDVERLYATISDGGRVPDAIAFNAGTGRAGKFVDASLRHDLDIVDVNVRSTVHLAKLVLRDIANHNAGRALFTSSIVAMMPGSYQTMYNASKAFIQSFAEGLHDEFGGSGVSVTSLMPGPTDTEFFRRAGMVNTPLGRLPFKDDPAKTAKQGYDAMMRRQQKVVASSLITKMAGLAARVIPDSVKARANRIAVAPFEKSHSS